MRWLLEIFLQMNKCTGGLNEPLEKVVITRTSIQPKLLQDIVRIVVTLLIPAAKIRVVKWVLWDFDVLQIGICAHQICNELRNPLAFSHARLNLIAA